MRRLIRVAQVIDFFFRLIFEPMILLKNQTIFRGNDGKSSVLRVSTSRRRVATPLALLNISWPSPPSSQLIKFCRIGMRRVLDKCQVAVIAGAVRRINRIIFFIWGSL